VLVYVLKIHFKSDRYISIWKPTRNFFCWKEKFKIVSARYL
jgi:hypothetical protein